MSLSADDLEMAIAALDAIAQDPREPRRYRSWYRQAARNLRAELALAEAWEAAPPMSLDPALRDAVAMWQAFRQGRRVQLQWVMSQTLHDQLVTAAARAHDPTGWVWPTSPTPVDPAPSSLPAYMFGVPVRIDDHATTLMLEMIPR